MSLSVLVVDDSAVMRCLIIKALDMSGLPIGEIHQAGNGVEGLDIINNHWIDLALVDINMPIMNGEEMIHEIRKNRDTEHIPVIVVSTESSEKRIETLKKTKAGFVHKPFSPELLKEEVMDVLGGGLYE